MIFPVIWTRLWLTMYLTGAAIKDGRVSPGSDIRAASRPRIQGYLRVSLPCLTDTWRALMKPRYIFLELDPARSVHLKESARKHVKTFQYHMRTHLRGIGHSGVCRVRPVQTSETDPWVDFRFCWLYQRCLVARRCWHPTCQRSFLSSYEYRRIERTRTRQRRSCSSYTGHC